METTEMAALDAAKTTPRVFCWYDPPRWKWRVRTEGRQITGEAPWLRQAMDDCLMVAVAHGLEDTDV